MLVSFVIVPAQLGGRDYHFPVKEGELAVAYREERPFFVSDHKTHSIKHVSNKKSCRRAIFLQRGDRGQMGQHTIDTLIVRMTYIPIPTLAFF